MHEAAHAVGNRRLHEVRSGLHIGRMKIAPRAPWRRERRAVPDRVDVLQQGLEGSDAGAGEIERGKLHALRAQRLAFRTIAAGGAHRVTSLCQKGGRVAA